MILAVLLIWCALALATALWLRHRLAAFQRLNDLNWAALVLIDIAAAFVVFWPLYLVGLLAARPLPWTTISTFCAACALQDRGWAVKAAAVIDALFFGLTSQRDHCMKSYVTWCAPLGEGA